MEKRVLGTENQTTSELLAGCQNGDRDAMRELYTMHQRRVYSIALNFFGGRAEMAEDVTQQVFLKIFKKFNFRGDSTFTTWLYRTTVNACIDEQRRSKRFFNIDDWFSFPPAMTRMSLNERLSSNQITAEVQTVIAGLKPKYRIPILLKYVEEMSYQEIAEIMECSIGTVSSRLNRGHRLLAAKLEHLRNEI